jgi:hypothetical protein
LQNENRNPAQSEPREALTLQAARKLNVRDELAPVTDERKRYEELREEDPERWDGMS